MNLAKAVANAAAMLVLKAKNVAQVAEDTVLQNRVIAAATQCALSTSQLVACAKVGVCVWVTWHQLDVRWSLQAELKPLSSCTCSIEHVAVIFKPSWIFMSVVDSRSRSALR